jgi:hypothetical protein
MLRAALRLLPGNPGVDLLLEAAVQNLTELHEALARVVLAERELSEVLTQITGIARRAMPSIEAASVTLIRGEKPFTAAYDGQMA